MIVSPIKWVGGKRRQASAIVSLIPEFDRYFEPFLGSASVFLLLSQDRPKKPRGHYLLSDACEPLIYFWQYLRDDPEYFNPVASIPNNEGRYLLVRERFNMHQDPIDFLYLNKTAFNGLYRTNANGKFNVPYGNYGFDTIDVQRLRLPGVSRLLKNAYFNAVDYEIRIAQAESGDFIYCDPPYMGAYNAYNGQPIFDQIRLRDALTRSEAKWLLSNADTPEVRSLYSKFKIRTIEDQDSVSADGRSRHTRSDLLISNY